MKWVPVIAGLVHDKLFPAQDSDIQGRSDGVLETAVSEIIPRLPVTVPERDFFAFSAFQPQEAPFFSRGQSADEPPLECSQNSHFVYTGEPPNFIAREEQLLAAKKAEEHQNHSRASLMPAASFRQKPSMSSGPSATAGSSGLRAGKTHTPIALSAFGGRAGAKKTVIAVSDSKASTCPAC